jgi:FkbM family methyltransferase
MIEHQGVWLPDGEEHFIDWMTKNGEIVDGRGTYQIKKLRAAMEHVRQFRTAVDVGAHCGLWSMQLAKRFKNVHAFEPVADHRDCFKRNVFGLGNVDLPAVYLHACALGENDGSVKMHSPPTSSGGTTVAGDGDIPLRRMDEFNLTDVDFIKLDCEGYELFALKGGEQTILRDKPTICVEQKPGKAQQFGLPQRGAVDYLLGLGYRLAREYSGDFIMVAS